jgi:hypothetical protein
MSFRSFLPQRFTRPAAVAVLGSFAALAVPAIASAQSGFAWACQPSTSSYVASSACAPWVYNSRSGAVRITRSSVGNYAVDFVGLGGRTTAGGIVHVTSYGGGNQICKVGSWNSGGTDFVVNVRCFLPTTGANADSDYDITVDWQGE